MELYTEQTNLKYTFDISQKFYNRFYIEKTIFGDISVVNEKKEVIHITLKKRSPDDYILQIETFNRMVNRDDSSHSEDDFMTLVESIQDNIVLLVNNEGKLLDINNFDSIQKTANDVIQRLSKKFTGRNAEGSFAYLKAYYQKKDYMMTDLKKYDKAGFFLNGFHSASKSYSLGYSNFMRFTNAYVDEKRQYGFDETKNVKYADIQGTLSLKTDYQNFRTGLESYNITYKPTNKALLNNYKGRIEFSEAGELLKSELNILFKYEESYTKTILYEIEEIDHEEL